MYIRIDFGCKLGAKGIHPKKSALASGCLGSGTSGAGSRHVSRVLGYIGKRAHSSVRVSWLIEVRVSHCSFITGAKIISIYVS